MREKNEIKISLKKAIAIIVILLIAIFGVMWFIYHIQTTPSSSITTTDGMTATTTIYADTNQEIPTNSDINYNILTSYYYDMTYMSELNLENLFITSNNELKTYLIKTLNSADNITINEQEVLEYFDDDFFETNNLAIQMYNGSVSNHHYSIASITMEESIAIINIKDNFYTYGGTFTPNIVLNFIELDKSITSVNFEIYRTTTDNSYDSNFEMMFIAGIVISITIIIVVSMIVIRHNRKVSKIENKEHTKLKKVIFRIIIVILIIVVIFFALIFYIGVMSPNTTVYKPIIYLYPTEDTEVSVVLGNSNNITVSYPKYLTGWNVLAEPDGTLTDLAAGRSLYSLYYESTNNYNFEVTNDGFCVKGNDVAEFLEEKLAILGLTEREAEEFIIYWLPILQENEYNYIRFATFEEIEENMPLKIEPKPDTIIRVLMTYKGLDEPIGVEEQDLVTPERTGFVAVEWGGTEIK